jgi:apolipoprotein D and lipocalin family protein
MMKLKVFWLFLIAFVPCFLAEKYLRKEASPPTVKFLDIPKYLGLWYQVSANALVYVTIEPFAFCVTALYGNNENGTISVRNYARTGSPTGIKTTIDGYAFQPDPTNNPGQLEVVFPQGPGSYWILELGPINSDNLYDWSIVSDSSGSLLFVLARNVTFFNENYRTEVNSNLTNLGFTGSKAPIDTYQGRKCIYES